VARIGSQDGDMRLACDQRIREHFRQADADYQIRAKWEKIDIPVLILHGSESGILSQEMLRRNLNAQAHVFDGIGHAPPPMSGDQIDVIIDFLSHRQKLEFTEGCCRSFF
jgi:pimeloyl-ACP methyl ester carboxylesterase